MENATKQAPLKRSVAVVDPAIKDLLAPNATKLGYCYPCAGHRLDGCIRKAEDFGTPFSVGGRRGGRPKGVSPGQTVVPDHCSMTCVTPHGGPHARGIRVGVLLILEYFIARRGRLTTEIFRARL